MFTITIWMTLYLSHSACSAASEPVKPHIVFIMADDVGWNDVSFHGSDQIPTPNIDTLAYHGVVLQQYYTDVASTATRTAFLTGKYPMRLGMQGKSLLNFEDRGIPLGERLLPSHLKELGYSTHLVGEWHVGMAKPAHLPTARGFDSFFGNLGGAVDSYTYNSVHEFEGTEYFGLDLYNNTEPVKNRSGYITDLLTERVIELIYEHNEQEPMFLLFCPTAAHAAPSGGLQSPHPDSPVYPSIAHTARRAYADIITNLDNSLGQIVSALSEKSMLKNTIIIFTSDNGAPTTGSGSNYGSNLPFRGIKNTPWEGGVRVPAVVWSLGLKSEIWNGLFHVTDWLPTLISAAGGKVLNRTLDGVSQWSSISVNTNSKRKEVLITINDEEGFAAYRRGDYKIIIGNVKNGAYAGTKLMALRKVMPAYKPILLSCETANVFNAYLKISLNITTAMAKRNATIYHNKTDPASNKTLCTPTPQKGCLFHVKRDPLEARDLWDSSPDLIRHLTLRLRAYWSEMIPRHPLKRDNRSDPALNNYIWAPWNSEVEEIQVQPDTSPVFPLKITMADLQSLVDVNFHSFSNNLTEYIRTMSDSLFRSVACLFYNSTICYKSYNNIPQISFL